MEEEERHQERREAAMQQKNGGNSPFDGGESLFPKVISNFESPSQQNYSIVVRNSNPNSRSHRKLRTNTSFNVLNFAYIDEAALKGQKGSNYSFLSQYFDYKRASHVNLTDDYLYAKMQDRNVQKVSVYQFSYYFRQYLVERLKSYGDKKLYQISKVIEELEKVLQKATKIMEKHAQYHSQELLKELLQKYRGKPYFGIYLTYENGEFITKGGIVSKGVISLLGYKPEQLAIKFSRLGAMRDLQVFSPASYTEIMLNFFRLMYRYHSTLLQKGFSHEIWQDLTKNQIHSTTEVYTRFGEKIIAKTAIHMPYPCIVLNQITQIMSRTQQFSQITLGSNKAKNLMEYQSQQVSNVTMNESEFYRQMNRQLIKKEERSLMEISKLSPNTLVSNDNHICKFRMLSKQQMLQKKRQISRNQEE